MSELEQLIERAIQALAENTAMDADDKSHLCDKIERMAYQAGRKFREEWEAELDRRDRERDAA